MKNIETRDCRLAMEQDHKDRLYDELKEQRHNRNHGER